MTKTTDEMRMPTDRVEWHLWNWAEWQRNRASDYGTGHSSRASGGISGSAWTTFDAMVANADRRCADAVEAILEGLSPAQRGAIHHRHLYASYKFRSAADEEAQYAAGRDRVRHGLIGRGIV